MPLEFGSRGKLLVVNLSDGSISTRPLEADDVWTFFGGRGLGAQLLFELAPPDGDYANPDNPFMLLSGPLTGTIFPTANRTFACSLSPLTGAYGGALGGGSFMPELKLAGYDGLIVLGKADRPVYLDIRNKVVTIRDAQHLCGKWTTETREAIRQELGDKEIKTCSIGPAGEKLVRYACLIFDGRAAGRAGLGASMGVKNLKAVAVRGIDSIPLAKPTEFVDLMLNFNTTIAASPAGTSLRDLGTARGVDNQNQFGILPTRNFIDSEFVGHTEWSTNYYHTEHYVRDFGCFSCPVACTNIARVRKGKYAGTQAEGPEYETFYALGSNCGNADMASIVHGDRLCDELGLDSMSAGSSIGFAMECFERGILSKSDVDGFELRFGNSDALIDLLPKIANREGFGDLLAEGVRLMARKLGKGSDHFAMEVKGMELGGYDPRALKAQGLCMATSERGGCHHFGGYAVHAETSGNIDNLAVEGKGQVAQKVRRTRIWCDSATMCSFLGASVAMQPDNLAEALRLATGLDFTGDHLQEVADRIIALERCINARYGLSRKDDYLPKRLLTEEVTSGPWKGNTISQEQLDSLLDQFYTINGFDLKTGIPTAERLDALGLTAARDELYGAKV